MPVKESGAAGNGIPGSPLHSPPGERRPAAPPESSCELLSTNCFRRISVFVQLNKDDLGAVGHIHKIAGGHDCFHTLDKVILFQAHHVH